jgi:PilZ domain-containing protein
MSENSDKTTFASVPSAGNSEKQESSSKLGYPERRGQERFPFNADADIVELRSRTRSPGRCSDLGSGGCYVDTMAPFSVGAEVRIRIKRESREFEAAAVVTYSHSSLGMGMKFTGISREHQEVLNSWLAEVSGGACKGIDPPQTQTDLEAAGDTNFLLVLNQLVALLVRKKILTESEGSGLLRKMFR